MAFQDWNYPNNLQFYWRKTTPLPASQNFLLKVKDIFGEPEAVGFSNLEFLVRSNETWLTITGDFTRNVAYPITGVGISGNVIVTLNSQINTFNPLERLGLLIFELSGQTPQDVTNGTRTIIDTKSTLITLFVYAANQPLLSPDILEFTHYYQTTKPAAKNVNVEASGNWRIDFAGPGLRYEIVIISGSMTIVDTGIGLRYITGTGNGVFSVTFTQVYLDTLNVGVVYNVGIHLLINNEFLNKATKINLKVLPPLDIAATPNSLFFSAIKTVQEAPNQLLNIVALYDYTINTPSWAVVSPSSGLVGTSDFSVGVIPSSSLNAGTYQDNIIIAYNNGNGDQTFLIPITYLVEGFIVLPYSDIDFNFTLDNKMVSFYTDLVDTFFDMLMNIKTFDFFTGEESNYIIPLKIVLLRNRQTENIGLKIHRVMKRILELDLSQTKMYKTCEVDITVIERKLANLSVERSFTLEKVKFIAGLSPKKIKDGMAILSIYDGPTRVTKNSKQIVNLLLKNGSFNIDILVNNVSKLTYPVNGDGYNIISEQIDFDLLEVTHGDVVEYRLYTSASNYISKLFYVFPDNVENLRVVWEDEYKLLSSFQFTGDYKAVTDFSIKSFKKYKDLVEITENINTDKEVKVTLDTGFLLKTEHIAVESLCRSKRAWIVFDNQTIEIIPQTKNILSIDNDAELKSFSLEFLINRKTDEEIYTF